MRAPMREIDTATPFGVLRLLARNDLQTVGTHLEQDRRGAGRRVEFAHRGDHRIADRLRTSALSRNDPLCRAQHNGSVLAHAERPPHGTLFYDIELMEIAAE